MVKFNIYIPDKEDIDKCKIPGNGSIGNINVQYAEKWRMPIDII